MVVGKRSVNKYKRQKHDDPLLNKSEIMLPVGMIDADAVLVDDSSLSEQLCLISNQLSDQLNLLRFPSPVTHVYNAFDYAFSGYSAYVKKYAHQTCQYLMVGMNPGPFGMAQSGVPFGDVTCVQTYLHLDIGQDSIGKPMVVHPKRPIYGMSCPRREISGSRVFAFAEQYFGSASEFFQHFFIYNYCPLAFMERSGKNRTPNQLPKAQLSNLEHFCDAALAKYISLLKPRYLIAIGQYSYTRCLAVKESIKSDLNVIQVMHPSPSNPKANVRPWGEIIMASLKLHNVELPTICHRVINSQ